MRSDLSPATCALVLAAVTLITTGSASGLADTLYVDQASAQCSDAGAGSAAEPFCTIGAAAAQAVAGQTVIVATGTYTEDVTPSNSGASGAPIVFTAAPGASVTVTGHTNGFTLSSKSWITVQGFSITGTTGDGVSVSNSAIITIAGNHVSSCGQPVSGQTARGIRLSATTDSMVASNTVDHNTDFGIFLTNGTTGVTVVGNDISYNARGFERAAAGIHVYGSTGNVIDGNVSHDNEDSGIDFSGGANDNLVRNNLCYRNGDHGIGAFGSTGQRIVANSVYKNVTAGIAVYGSSGGATLANNISVDNGIDSPRTSGNVLVDSTSTTGATLDYDLVSSSQSGAMMVWGGTTYYSLAAFVAATGQEMHGIQADPQWTAPDAGDMHLLEGSPAIDSADSGASGQTPVDADGKPRVDDPSTPNTGAGPRPYDDRGAYESTPAAITTTTTTTTSTTTSTSSTTTTSAPTTTSTSTTAGAPTTTTQPPSTSTSSTTSTTRPASTSTTTAPPPTSTTSTTLGGQPSTTSTTTLPPAHPTTTTTLPVAEEICGNCIDDDGNGLTDFEDPACCAQNLEMHVRRMKLVPASITRTHGNRLRVKAVYGDFTPSGFDPSTEDTTIQIADANGEIFCQTIAASHWTHRRPRLFRFRDKHASFAGGLKKGRFKVKRNGKVLFRTRGKRLTLRAPEGGHALVTVRVGNRCSRTEMSLRRTARALVFP